MLKLKLYTLNGIEGFTSAWCALFGVCVRMYVQGMTLLSRVSWSWYSWQCTALVMLTARDSTTTPSTSCWTQNGKVRLHACGYISEYNIMTLDL